MKSARVGECKGKHALSLLKREIKNLVIENNIENLTIEELLNDIDSMVKQTIEDRNVCEFFNCAKE